MRTTRKPQRGAYNTGCKIWDAYCATYNKGHMLLDSGCATQDAQYRTYEIEHTLSKWSLHVASHKALRLRRDIWRGAQHRTHNALRTTLGVRHREHNVGYIMGAHNKESTTWDAPPPPTNRHMSSNMIELQQHWIVLLNCRLNWQEQATIQKWQKCWNVGLMEMKGS